MARESSRSETLLPHKLEEGLMIQTATNISDEDTTDSNKMSKVDWKMSLGYVSLAVAIFLLVYFLETSLIKPSLIELALDAILVAVCFVAGIILVVRGAIISIVDEIRTK